ncbi:nudix hydrolase 22, chloroplastic-like [Tasmannia lanceolata]|uniref:nudix hydrolase 22, chloroplastic-like n=1 Tax=Tasmannia lanceolata TaxID=3420 RepID=UPI00406409D8
MDSINGSHRLRNLAQQLRLYKPPSSEINNEEEQERAKNVISQVGLPESKAPIPPSKFRPKRAAVLICLFEGDAGDLRVILTKRSSKLSTHSGEVSLPGGKREEGDVDEFDTATREAKEEIGLDPLLVTRLAVLEPFLSLHLLRVVPVIGILSDKQAFKPTVNASEVEAIFDAPLEMFLKDENRRFQRGEWMGTKYIVHFFDFEVDNKKYVIFGLTAGILIHAASIVYQRPPSFEEFKPNFKIRGSVKEGDTIT